MLTPDIHVQSVSPGYFVDFSGIGEDGGQNDVNTSDKSSRPSVRPSGRGRPRPRPSSIGRSEISCFVPIKMHGAAATLHSWSRLTRFRGTDDACGITIDRASQCSVLPKRERASFRNAEPILGIRWRELQTYLPRNVCQLQVRKSKRGEDE